MPAIAWKQSNGFYYPPAFHSNKLYFNNNVDIRHFVIEPLFLPGTFTTDYTQSQVRYCIYADDMFNVSPTSIARPNSATTTAR